ncbi:hypothetical protein B0O79_3871 [Flavobacteriaceae bacterium MAR_2009_75]|nr:hypothetical protein B0O79_3871 [Flavobacteriaceae bacterium MAR_2009_75]
MAGNDNYGLSTNNVFTYEEARNYDKYLQSQPTFRSHSWRDVKTGGLVGFNHF